MSAGKDLEAALGTLEQAKSRIRDLYVAACDQAEKAVLPEDFAGQLWIELTEAEWSELLGELYEQALTIEWSGPWHLERGKLWG